MNDSDISGPLGFCKVFYVKPRCPSLMMKAFFLRALSGSEFSEEDSDSLTRQHYPLILIHIITIYNLTNKMIFLHFKYLYTHFIYTLCIYKCYMFMYLKLYVVCNYIMYNIDIYYNSICIFIYLNILNLHVNI